MTPLEIIKDAYTRAGVCYAEQVDDGYTYIVRCAEHRKTALESMALQAMLNESNEFMEFESNGAIASY